MGKVTCALRNFFDFLTVGLLVAIFLALFFPPTGALASFFDILTDFVVALLFFLHGAKLSPDKLLAGISAIRAQIIIILSTFFLFPILALLLSPLMGLVLKPDFLMGILFLSALPSTVQSSITFTSIARGNIALAVSAASASSILGVFVSPLIVSLILDVPMAATKLDILWDLCLKLLFPFALGQLSRRWTKDFIEHHDGLLAITDRLSVIFIVFVSFSGATVEGLWHLLDLTQFLIILLCCMVILALALTITAVLGKLLNFKIEDRISIIFCGSKKSLMAGVPMAGIIFSPSIAGLIILPLMIFHQLQLLVCAQIARKFASRKPEED